ncbi:hypothetical protein D4R87_00795 [bacterium]|nr:MAG: hypothetical protein D4R87_00795 [bacterium]
MKIITQNLYCHDEWENKKDNLFKMLKEINADILCFQELSARKIGNDILLESVEIEKELKKKGFYVLPEIWGKDYSPKKGIYYNENNFDQVETLEINLSGLLPDGQIDKHRISVIACRFVINKKSFWVLNLHLSTIKDFRYNNWQEINNWIEKNNDIRKDNILIVGDLNSYKESVKGRSDVEMEIEKAKFINILKEFKNERPVTFFSSDWWLEKYPEHSVSKRIKKRNKFWDEGQLDYIFARGNFDFKKIDYINSVPDISDHRGLIAQFDLK